MLCYVMLCYVMLCYDLQMTCSPDGSKIAIMGAGGYSHILDAKAKTSICDVKMNSPLRAQCFLSDTSFITSGLDAEVYIWDIRKVGRCLAR